MAEDMATYRQPQPPPSPSGRSRAFATFPLTPEPCPAGAGPQAAGQRGASTRRFMSFKLLGFLDVKNVPCARESVLYGSLGSLVVGLGHFLATSRVRRSCDFAVGGFICTMLGYWFYCRYNLAQQRIRQRMLKEGMRNKMLFEGSSFDPEKKQTGNERSNS
ncbi:protein FAM36A isoform X1 [Gallus gallus]|uniref:protein FAM36A isoform X1 n=1 Tax=Gallus gallus TaxID=9031 RepID=UPI000739E0F7|nr:protein FAM36A isoform X1 [Gallus gallus]|eukprot:XP_015139433.1 protein FAM36A isoform X1 [Gallus gallus]